MDLLVLGGTAFLGREVAAQAVGRGWAVTCAARGESGDFPDGVEVVRIDRDAEEGLNPLSGHRWDAVVDVSRQPGQVRRAVRDLETDHFVFVSTGNVYADTSTRGLDESTPLLPPLVGESFTNGGTTGPPRWRARTMSVRRART